MGNRSVDDESSKSVDDARDTKENPEKNSEEKVDYKTYSKVLDKLKATEKQNKSLEERLGLLEGKEKSAEEKNKSLEEGKLIEKGEYKKLLELREKEILETKAALEKSKNEINASKKDLADTWKLQSFYDKLPGKIKRREYLDFVPLDEIVFNPESGEIDMTSVETTVNKFMEQFPDLVDTSHIKALPGNAAQGGSGGHLVGDRFKALPLKDMKTNLKDSVQKRIKELKMV